MADKQTTRANNRTVFDKKTKKRIESKNGRMNERTFYLGVHVNANNSEGWQKKCSSAKEIGEKISNRMVKKIEREDQLRRDLQDAKPFADGNRTDAFDVVKDLNRITDDAVINNWAKPLVEDYSLCPDN